MSHKKRKHHGAPGRKKGASYNQVALVNSGMNILDAERMYQQAKQRESEIVLGPFGKVKLFFNRVIKRIHG